MLQVGQTVPIFRMTDTGRFYYEGCAVVREVRPENRALVEFNAGIGENTPVERYVNPNSTDWTQADIDLHVACLNAYL